MCHITKSCLLKVHCKIGTADVAESNEMNIEALSGKQDSLVHFRRGNCTNMLLHAETHENRINSGTMARHGLRGSFLHHRLGRRKQQHLGRRKLQRRSFAWSPR